MSRRGTAYHEAAHAVVALFLGLDVQEITIRGKNPHVRASQTRSDFQGAVIGAAGAYAAAKAGEKHSARPSRSDVDEMSHLPESQQHEAMESAWAIVNNHWADIERVAAALMANG